MNAAIYLSLHFLVDLIITILATEGTQKSVNNIIIRNILIGNAYDIIKCVI